MKDKGRLALITGASAGIGAAFARAYAKRGADVALVARRAERLEAIAAEIRTRHGVEAMTVSEDLADPAAPARIVNALADRNRRADILVNNAGFGLPGNFHASSWEDHRRFIELMVTSYAHLTRLILPHMQQNRWGRIIQVASVAGLVPGSSGHTLYGPAKAFLVSFAQSLAAENEDNGVKVSALCPGFTYSEFHDVNKTRGLVSKLPKYMFMEAEPVVAGAIAAVDRGHVVYVPGLWNKFLVGLVKAMPRPWAAAMVKRQSAAFRNQHD